MTRTSDTWNCLPGSFDALNCDSIFPSSNVYHLPDIKPFTGEIPQFMVPVTQRLRGDYDYQNTATHFFIDDYHFERFWKSPVRTYEIIYKTGAVLTPDFSVYTDYPMPAQLWNVYRSRWFGALWQDAGLQVIPTVTWADISSHTFCFEGIAKGSTVAISAVGCSDNMPLFDAGYRAMVSVIDPAIVLCYGKLPIDLLHLCDVREYSTRWDEIRKTAKPKQKQQLSNNYKAAN